MTPDHQMPDRNHQILDFEERPSLPFTFEGRRDWRKARTIASALIANGIKVFSHSINLGRQGILLRDWCASCNMVVDEKTHPRACITIGSRDGDQTSDGKGDVLMTTYDVIVVGGGTLELTASLSASKVVPAFF